MKAVACAANNRIFLAAQPEGEVHSLFSHSVNLQFGQRLMHISDGRYGRQPFGLVVEQCDLGVILDALQRGDRTCWVEKAQYLSFPCQGLVLSLAHASFYQTQIKRQAGPVQPDNWAAFQSSLLAEPKSCGLEFTVNEVLMLLKNGTSHEKLIGLTKLKQAANSEAAEFITPSLRYFLGRGMGLTPSGDDVIVGFLAAATARGILSSSFLAIFNSLIAVEGHRLTTQIGLEYLYYAGQGQFSSQLSELVAALYHGEPDTVRQRTEQILQNGHTSGLDTLIGLLIGLFHQ